RTTEDRLPAAAGAADLPAGAVRRGRAPLRAASRTRAARGLGRAEAPLGPEALAARRRPRPAPHGLEEPAHRRAQAGRLARQPLRDAARRSGGARPVRRPLACLDPVDGAPSTAPARAGRAARRSGRAHGSKARPDPLEWVSRTASKWHRQTIGDRTSVAARAE